MAEPQWVYLERFRGNLRRVTLLDDDLNVISTHDRGDPTDLEPDDCQLLRAVELVRTAGVLV
jgi:hypothetical protein